MTSMGAANHDPKIRAIVWRLIGRHLFLGTFHNWYALRQKILAIFGARLGPNTKFRRTVQIDRPWNLSAGELAMVGDHVILRARRPISIGDRAVVSQLTIVSTEMRDLHSEGFLIASAPIALEDDTWIAADSLVVPGAIVREGGVVGARSLVEGELPRWTVSAGEPAIPRRPRELRRNVD